MRYNLTQVCAYNGSCLYILALPLTYAAASGTKLRLRGWGWDCDVKVPGRVKKETRAAWKRWRWRGTGTRRYKQQCWQVYWWNHFTRCVSPAFPLASPQSNTIKQACWQLPCIVSAENINLEQTKDPTASSAVGVTSWVLTFLSSPGDERGGRYTSMKVLSYIVPWD